MVFFFFFKKYFLKLIDCISAKEGEALNEPPDENEYTHQYSPVNVKMNRVDDV